MAEWRARQQDFLAAVRPSPGVAAPLATLRAAVHAATPAAPATTAGVGPGGLPRDGGLRLGVHVRRDDPRVDAPNLELPPPRLGAEGNDAVAGDSSDYNYDSGTAAEGNEPWTPVGWSEVPWSEYATLAALALEAQPGAVVLVFSNEPAAARAVAEEVCA